MNDERTNPLTPILIFLIVCLIAALVAIYMLWSSANGDKQTQQALANLDQEKVSYQEANTSSSTSSSISSSTTTSSAVAVPVETPQPEGFTVDEVTAPITELLLDHNRASNLNGDATAEASLFAANINFFGKTKTRAEVMKDFANYAAKWDVQRNFTITGGRAAIKITKLGPYLFQAIVPKSYTLENTAGKVKTGELVNIFQLRYNQQEETFEIISMRE